MSQTGRIVRIRNLLDARRAVSRRTLLETLAVSVATLKRDIAFLRDTMSAVAAEHWHPQQKGSFDPGWQLRAKCRMRIIGN